MGFDVVSRERAFASLHPKLLKSYAMEAVLDAGQDSIGGNRAQGTDEPRSFLAEAAGCDEKSYNSVGMGSDFRYTGKKVIGSALAVEDHVVHTAFFRASETEIAGRMAGASRRRGFRTI
jgi:hypothetical protein